MIEMFLIEGVVGLDHRPELQGGETHVDAQGQVPSTFIYNTEFSRALYSPKININFKLPFF
jgi:hypothetical protein